MASATLTTKGQITIPAAVRTALRLEAGDRLEFVEAGPGCFEIVAIKLPITALRGLVARPAAPVSVEDMSRAVRRRAGRSSPA